MMCIIPYQPRFLTSNNSSDDDDDKMNKNPDKSTPKQRQQQRQLQQRDRIIIHPNDVLAGRGNGVAAHPGNQLFRNVCIRHQQAYHKAKRHEKMAIAKRAVEEIKSQTPPGRFLEKFHGAWVLMAPKRVLEKTSQALRDRSSSGTTTSVSSPTTSSNPSSTDETFVDKDVLVNIDGRMDIPMESNGFQQQHAAPAGGGLVHHHGGGAGGSLYQQHANPTNMDSTTRTHSNPVPSFIMNKVQQQQPHPPFAANVGRRCLDNDVTTTMSRMPPSLSHSNNNNNNDMNSCSSTLQLLTAARAILSNQDDHVRGDDPHLDQFCDADEEGLYGNTSLEIHYLAYRRGKFGSFS
mmetsp:Transcript_29752/g.53820  ORF Transcript_29752/g.53820 Transcript_29752/m.53820 type:complete len:348 (-) Transcript_29752:34-1077(-)